MGTEAPSGQGKSQSSRQALADAFQAAVSAEADKRAADARERARRPSPPWAGIVSVVLLLGVVGWLFVDRPAWLFARTPPEAEAVQDAGLRLTMYAAAVRIRNYQTTHRELPSSLGQVEGVSTDEIEYSRVGQAGWVLQGRRGNVRLLLRSEDALDAFLGTSLSQYTKRGGR